jgi:4-amino-4-deoxy-L-arabinose transferase-like glycosyltransferase
LLLTTALRWLNRYKLLVVVLLAIAVRVAFLAFFPDIFRFEETDAIHGSTAYDTYASNLLATGVYGRTPGEADAMIAPLYSYVLAGVYRLVGRGGWQVGLFHTLLDVLSILMLYEIGRRLFKGTASQQIGFSASQTPLENGRAVAHPYTASGEWVGSLAGLFYALYPYLIFQNLTLNDTALFMLLLHAFVLCMVLLREQPSLNRQTWLIAILGGVILGLTTLARALLPPFALLVAVWFLFRLNLKQTILRLLPVALVSVAVVLLWLVHASGIYGGFVAVALNGGENVYQGANDMTIPLFQAGYDVQWSPPPASVEGVHEPFERNARLMQAGIDWLKTHPERIPELMWVKFGVHWSIDVAPRTNPLPGAVFTLDDAGKLVVTYDPDKQNQDENVIAEYSGGLFDTVGRPVHILYYGALFGLALVGLWLTRRQWRDVALLWFVQINMTVLYLIFHPSTRYRVPTDPLLFLFSAAALVWLMQRVAQANPQFFSRYFQSEARDS